MSTASSHEGDVWTQNEGVWPLGPSRKTEKAAATMLTQNSASTALQNNVQKHSDLG